MLNKLHFWIFVMFLLVPLLVNAGTQQDLFDASLIIWFPSVNLLNDNSTSPKADATTTGSPAYVTTGTIPISDATGFFPGGTAYVKFTTTTEYLAGVRNQSVVFLSNYTGEGSGTRTPFSTGAADVDEKWRINFDGTNLRNFLITDTGSILVDISETAHTANSEYEMLVFTVEVIGNSVTLKTYINDTEKGSGSNTNGFSDGFTDDVFIGTRSANTAHGFFGGLNALYYFNKTLTQSDTTFLFNSGNFIYLTPEAAPATTCDCPTSGDWFIEDGSVCNLTTSCDIPNNNIFISSSSSLTVHDDVTLTCNSIQVETANSFFMWSNKATINVKK